MNDKNLSNKNTIIDKSGFRILISLFICVTLYISFVSFFHLVFFINDDENIMYTLSGYYTYGIPDDHPFINVILSAILRRLYGIFPSIQWYSLFHIFIIAGSIVLFNDLLLKYLNRKCHLIFILLVIILLDIAIFSYVMILMQFTTTSALAGCTAILLLYDYIMEIKKGNRRIIHIPFIITYSTLCYWHRKNTFYVIACFLLLLFIYCILINFAKVKENKSLIIHWLIMLFLIPGAIILSIIANMTKRNSNEWKYYNTYDSARYHMTDYPHDSFIDNPDLYEQIGWSNELYTLTATNYWFFMDEKINENTFDVINSTYTRELEPKKIFTTWISFLKKESIALFESCILFLLIIINIIQSIIKHDKLRLLLCICLTLGTILLISYLCLIQRIPLRAYQTIMFPSIIISILDLTHNITEEFCAKKYIFFSIFSIVLILISIKTLIKAQKDASYRYSISRNTLSIEEYAINHPENIYIYDTSLTFRYEPFTIYKDFYPSNLFFWGGMGWNSPAFKYQLELNGLSDLYSDVFFSDNVYYITRPDYYVNSSDTSLSDIFFSYMEKTYGNYEIKTMDSINNDDILVYKLSLEEY